jgi:complex iron-sulfur molybdoenzyme family reductase subunit gamma
MRRVVLVGLVLLTSAARAEVPQSFLERDVVVAKKVAAGAPRTDDDPRWQQARAFDVTLVPQRSVRLNDAAANAALATSGPTQATVRALVTEEELALLVEWVDATEDRSPADASGDGAAFGDGVAVEIPARFGRGVRLPYIGMGDEGEHVLVSMQRAVSMTHATGSVGREAVAAGFGSLTRAPQGDARSSLRRVGDRWRAVFVRPLATLPSSSKTGLVPFALAVWDGARRERGGNKSLSSWKMLRIEGTPLDETYANELAWGDHPGDLGDPAKGKVLVESICVACHRVGEKKNAMEGFAPDLTNIGAIATAGYLRDSIVNPSAVVVQNLNINRHTVKTADASGAFPNNEMFRWYTVDASGKKTSKMPPFAAMPPQDVAAIVAFLKTLPAQPTPPGGTP